jgi:hypothetical protein
MSSLRLTDINDIKDTVLTKDRLGAWDIATYPNGQPFKRLGLTLSAKGWTASIEYQGTIGFRGKGETPLEAMRETPSRTHGKFTTSPSTSA